MADMLTYHIVPENLAEHVFNVKLSVPASKHNVIHLTLPAWIPGSYMIRDFSKNIHSIAAASPNKEITPIRQVDKQTWRVENAAPGLEVTYQVYAFDLSVRGAYLFDEYAFFNGTSTFLEVKEFTESATTPIVVNIINNQLDKDWQLCTSLTQQAVVEFEGNATHSFICEDYQELIDHPVLMGIVDKHTFEICGVRFHFVLTGNNETDVERICNDLKPICKHHIDLFDGLPEKDYWFITLLCEDGFGGLEHRASTALMFPRFHLPMRSETDVIPEQYQQFLSLCSHELFHAWNVKRIKPELMISPDLQSEQYMEQLWIYEGFTSLYDDLTLARTKIINPQRYAEILGENVTRLNRTQGRHKQTITQSSFDAWTKFYKQDAGSHNHIVSYYNKGAIIALALDITLRQMSNNRYSIDQLMQLLWSHYGIKNIGTPNDVIHTLCKAHFNIDISSFLDIAIYTTMDLPLDTMVQSIGLKLNLRSRASADDKGGKANKETTKHAFGATFKDQGSGVVLQTMHDGSPIVQAGAQLGDVLIALGQWQVNAGNLQRLLDNQQSSKVDITLLRQGRIIRSSLPIKPAINDTVYFTIENAEIFDAWISGAVSQ
ncbi:M61 family metallopeptidase [Brumicola nitratireducens]|uniref:Putative protease n=1 Tax=Glaciecola nitratireducens (strain JCM 12485 / KCTC 12276 / FR1064) TaxID=1085623 RepID=G4QLI9_GLANF|nr:M61 family metallopeptidase [Glaciecola nitratireducens]AEP30095.1 putative protease [Glaciecola nitratireducens FR1064]